jgi:P-type Cu2+ transporter
MARCKLCKREITADSGETVYCCHGCAAVDQIIQTMDLSDEERTRKVEQLLEVIFADEDAEDRPEAEQPDLHTKEEHLLLTNMVCPACSWLIHHSLAKQPGILSATVNFVSESMTIRFNPMKIGMDEIEKRLEALGYGIRAREAPSAGFDYYGFGVGWFFAINVMMLSFVVYSAESWHVPAVMQRVCWGLMAVFTVLTLLFGGRLTIKKGIAQFRNLDFRMESLIVLSTATALIYSAFSIITGNFERLYFDVVCLLIMLLETGNMITKTFYNRLRRRVFELADHLPKKVRADEEEETYRDTETLEPADRFYVKGGEIVPTDGVLLCRAEFDFSLINGESNGVELAAGQFVGAGAKLLSDRCALRVPDGGASSLIKSIIESTIGAFNSREENESTGDRISKWFVPVILVLAISGAAGHLIWATPQSAVLTFMAVLIVACPCAFGIAEPLVLTSAVDRVKRLGIQVFNGNIMRLRPTTVVFDKTGTLTTSAVKISAIHWLADQRDQDLDIIASLESGIEHPLAKVLATLGKGLDIEERRSVVGSVSGTFQGTRYRCGKVSLFPDLEIPEAVRDEAATLVAYGDEEQARALIVLQDEVREETPTVLYWLREFGVALRIFSGDREPAVERVARELGIPHASEMSPTDKQDRIRALQAEGECVMMVGDGINDAQSLATADIGLAVFSGQLPAQMSADAVFLTPDLGALPRMIAEMKIAHRRIKLNYGWAFAYNLAGVSLAMAGLLTPTYCAVGMVFSNFVVIFNSLRRSNSGALERGPASSVEERGAAAASPLSP